MKYHRKIQVAGGDTFELAVNITGHGAPTEDTEANPGMIYMDEDSKEGDLYKCLRTVVKEDGGIGYIWKKLTITLTEADKSEIAGMVIDLLPETWILSLRVTTPSNGNVIAELYKDGVICTDRMYLRVYVSSQGGEWRVHGTGSGYFTGEKTWSYGGGDEGVAWKCEAYADENMTEMLALASAATGTKGAPGHTPVKGTDYFTDADKQEIAAAAADMVDVTGKLDKSGGTMTGALVAQTNTNYTTPQVRNVIYLAEGESVPATHNGDLVLFYK